MAHTEWLRSERLVVVGTYRVAENERLVVVGTYRVAARCAAEAFSTTCAVHIEDCEGMVVVRLSWISVRTSQEPGVSFSVTVAQC